VLIIALLMSSCGTGAKIESGMAIAGHISSISDSADSIDNYVVLATERNDVSILKPIGEETKSIRSEAKKVKQRVAGLMEEKAELEKKLTEEKKLVWVDLFYRLAPVVLGVVILLIGRFLTQDPADTKFGIACFFAGIAINAFYDTVGNWGIIGMLALGLGWFFYSHEKKDLAKKMIATRFDMS